MLKSCNEHSSMSYSHYVYPHDTLYVTGPQICKILASRPNPAIISWPPLKAGQLPTILGASRPNKSELRDKVHYEVLAPYMLK